MLPHSLRSREFRRQRISKQSPGISLKPADYSFTFFAKQAFPIPFLPLSDFALFDIGYFDVSMGLVVEWLKTEFGNDVRFAQRRFFEAEATLLQHE